MTSVDKSSEEFFGKVIEEAMRMRAEEHSVGDLDIVTFVIQ